MGIDLCIMGNHKIEFFTKNFDTIYSEIEYKLNNMIIKNYTYIKWAKLRWEHGHLIDEKEIKNIDIKINWSSDDSNPLEIFNKYKEINFSGPLYLNLSFNENHIEIHDPPYRYKSWFEFENIHQNEWRKYLYTVVNTFGGDRVIYLPDSGIPSSAFAYYDGAYEELEKNLLENYGKSKNDLSEVTNEHFEDYFLDKLDNINWNIEAPIDYYFPETVVKEHFSGTGHEFEKFDPQKYGLK